MHHHRIFSALFLFLAVVALAGCAGFRSGWESVAYVETPPEPSATGAAQGDSGRELELPGLRMQVSMDNRLQTSDVQVYLYVLPLSFDPRDTYSKNVEPGKTRVFLTVTPESEGFVLHPGAAVLQVGDERHSATRGLRFGMWDEHGNRVKQGGTWEHRDVGAAFALEVGAKYLLSLVFDRPVPPPGSAITLDLSRALVSPTQPTLPLIRFAPAKWEEAYS